MTTGFQAFTDSGLVQIDTEGGMPNWQLRQKMVQPAASGTWPAFTQRAFAGGIETVFQPGFVTTFSFSAISPLVAFTCDSGYLCPTQFSQSGNSYSVLVVCPNPCNVTCYVFDQNDFSVGTSTYGMQVFDDNGRMVADVLAPFAKVLDFQSNNLRYGPGATGFKAAGDSFPRPGIQTFNYSVPQKIGICAISPAFVPSANAASFLTCFSTQGGQIGMGWFPFNTDQNNNTYVGFAESLTWAFSAIDLSFL